ncbi:hypothetical protein [Natroniella sp. ANB-PHB2]|uniref:hypothetical protein n=1 Tax=Natroniella sp. ANB-PHB2 TaxID=3384444 RepID=UPI0038D3A519
METTVYGVEMDLNQYKSVGEIIDAIEREGYIATQVIADQKDITRFSAQELESIKPIDHLEILAKTPREITLDSLKEAENYLPRLISGIDEIINSFSQGEKSKAYKLLNQALEGFQWLSILIDNLETISDSIYEDMDLNRVIKNWESNLNEFLTAFENQDIILLSDILEYELLPVLEEYLEIIKDLNENLEEQS